MTHAMQHCQRPWWKRPPVWLAVAVVFVILAVVIEQAETRTAAPRIAYGAFLDQIEAGNVASVTLQGTEIIGRFKDPAASSSATSPAQSSSFRSRVPDFGDPALIPALHQRHVLIDVTTPSAWTWLLGRVPWPMLIFVAVMLIAGLVRLARGKKAEMSSAAATLPAHGLIGLVSGLFAKRQPGKNPAVRDGDQTKSH